MAIARPITILNVDDSTVGRYAMTRTLQQAGFKVREASTGEDTLRLASENPDLIILDVKLPDMSGFEVCRRLKANPDTSSIPVLHLSARYVTSEDKVQGLESGADAYLVQPVESLELIATIKALLRMRQAEEIARTTAREWQTTFDAISDGLCLVDGEGRVVRCNQAMANLLQASVKEIEGCLYHALIKDTLGSIEAFPFARLQENRCRESVELEIGPRWFRLTADPVFDEQGAVKSAVYIMADISPTKQAQEALRETQAEQFADMARLLALSTRLATTLELQTILQEVLAAVISLQNADMGLLRLYDSEKQDLYAVASIGLSDEYLNLIGRIPRGMGACGRAIAQRSRALVEEVETDPIYKPYVQAAQLAGYRAVFSTPLFARNSEILGTIAIFFRKPHRPSEREIYLVELYAQHAGWAINNARLYQEAENANRLKDEFLATLSHELRSPLNAILGWTQLLRVKKFDADTTDRALETIERNAWSQTQLIEDLLDVSRIIRGQLRLDVRPVELVSVIEAAIDALRLGAEAKSITIKSELDFSGGFVSGDPARLQQVVWNLLSNAIKFTPNAGQVEVKLEFVNGAGSGEKREKSHHCPPDTLCPIPYSICAIPYAQIQVSDTGQGISREFLPHVFERFRQADSSTTRLYSGLGLGLAIVRHLVELHGGTIHAESEGEGKGATFTVKLPSSHHLSAITYQPSAFATLNSFLKTQLSLEGLRILIVDDEADAREVMARIVKEYGAEVMAVASAGEALAVFDGAFGDWLPDVLVSDIGMPEADGYTLIRQVRALDATRGGRVPAVAVTAYARAEDRIRAIASGFQQHFSKPVNPDQLAEAIANLTGRNGTVKI